MLRVFTCLTVEHDWRLVILAAAICFLGSVVIISLFSRARAAQGRARLMWLGLDAAAAGFGIWATHFIAMLAYEPGFAVGYDAVITGFSLLIAIVISGTGLAIALRNSFPWSPALAGAVLGAGIAAMHFTGMSALEVPARLTWSPGLVILAITSGMVFGGAAIFVAARRNEFRGSLIAALLLTLSIVSLHFTAICRSGTFAGLASIYSQAEASPPGGRYYASAACHSTPFQRNRNKNARAEWQ
jgi:NO-binding membrane sensor protein with MHYT domain